MEKKKEEEEKPPSNMEKDDWIRFIVLDDNVIGTSLFPAVYVMQNGFMIINFPSLTTLHNEK